MYVCWQYLHALCVYQPVWWLYLYVLIHMYINCRKMAKCEMCICVCMLVVWHVSVSIVCISACILMYWFTCTSIALAEKWLSVKCVICVCMLVVWHVLSVSIVCLSACIYTWAWVFNWYILRLHIESIKKIVANLCQSLEYIRHSVPASIPNKLIDRK